MLVIEIDDEKILVSAKVIKLSGLLTSIIDEHDNDDDIIFNNDKFSYTTYKDTISLCEKYSGNISEEVNVSILSCLNYLCCSEVLAPACKYLASLYYDINLMQFVIKHQNKDWNRSWLLNNKNISIKDIEKYPNISIESTYYDKWVAVSRDPTTTEEYIEEHLEYEWAWYYGISKNPNITENFVRKHIDKNWNWDHLAKNPNISLELLVENSSKMREGTEYFTSPNLTLEYVNKYIKKKRYGKIYEDTEELSVYEDDELEDDKFDIYDLRNDFDLENMLYTILSNSAITLNDIEFYLKHRGDIEYVSLNPNINMEFLKKYPKNTHWHFDCIARYPGIKLEDIENNPNYRWNWWNISRNININMSFVKKHINKSWNWYSLSKNPSITMQDVEDNPEYNWRYYGLSENPNLTLSFIENHIDEEWNWEEISDNSFTYERKMVCKKKYEELGLESDIINEILKHIFCLPYRYYQD